MPDHEHAALARYFAFGSNMNPSRVEQRGLVFHAVEGARLPDHALHFDKQSRDHHGTGHANIRPQSGAMVEGVLYHLAGPQEIVKMDHFERVPINYRRVIVSVQTAAGTLPAWTYVAQPAVIAEGLRPERAYLAHLLAGAPWLSPAYLARLRAWPCVDDPSTGQNE